MDVSDISQTSILNIGIFNSECEYHCLSSRVLVGKHDAVNTSELMHQMILPFENLKPKLCGIISDMAAYQLAANRRFSRMIGIDLQQLVCTLHHVSNDDKYFNQYFPKAVSAVHSSKMLFGSRQSWASSDCSLRNELEVALRIEENVGFSPFRSDRGSRFAVGYQNALSLLKYRELVLRVLETKRAKEQAAIQPYATELKQMLTQDWNSCCLELGMFIIHWRTILCPFYSALGKIVTLGTGKAFARQLQDQYNQLIESSDPFQTMLDFLTPEVAAEYPSLSTVTQMWQVAENEVKASTNELLTQAVQRVHVKVMKDTTKILELTGDHDELLPFSNNRCESSFSLIKVSCSYRVNKLHLFRYSSSSSAFPSKISWYG